MLGMAMVYTIAEGVQMWLQANNEKEKTAHEEMMDREREKNGPEEGEEGSGDEEEEDDGKDDGEGEWGSCGRFDYLFCPFCREFSRRATLLEKMGGVEKK